MTVEGKNVNRPGGLIALIAMLVFGVVAVWNPPIVPRARRPSRSMADAPLAAKSSQTNCGCRWWMFWGIQLVFSMSKP